jgi:hypothetical protein
MTRIPGRTRRESRDDDRLIQSYRSRTVRATRADLESWV